MRTPFRLKDGNLGVTLEDEICMYPRIKIHVFDTVRAILNFKLEYLYAVECITKLSFKNRTASG